MTAVPTARLAATAVCETVESSEIDLIAGLPQPTGALSVVRNGAGLVGTGVHDRFTATGPDAAQQIQRWFAGVCANLQVRDSVGVRGSGPVAFVSMGFDDDDVSIAIVPRTVLGRMGETTFTTKISETISDTVVTDSAGTDSVGTGPARRNGVAQQRNGIAQQRNGAAQRLVPVSAPGRVSYADAALSVADFTSAVTAATARIRAGELQKVVLAHDLEATTVNPVDERFLLDQLARAYPDCWTFAVEGLVGASPELLIRRSGTRIASRVLAGTAWKEHSDDAVSAGLLGSAKDIAEHAYAVQSVAQVLAAACADLDVPAEPVPLELANLTHLSSDITGRLDDRAPTALELAARLHPTAAVGGSPTQTARQLIRELEPMARGRYAGPVGWLDSRGDGEFAIALRCAQVTGRRVRLMAGCGIVADSDPETEAREAQIKMIPIRDALEARG